VTRRERWDIIGQVLDALEMHTERFGPNARVTNVATRANVAYDRLQEYLDELARSGLVTQDKMPRLTEKGKEFLRLYRQWREVLGRFGLDGSD